MNVLVLSASPNESGLTAACVKAACEGAGSGFATVTTVNLQKKNIAVCRQCSDGWGICKSEHTCIVKDEYQEVHEATKNADVLVLITPVYWGDMAESAKKFTDKVRRCEASKGDESALKDHAVICVAAAGGSGNGSMTCLASMERWVDHVKATKAGLFSITRMTREAILPAIREAVKALVVSPA